MSVNGKPIDTFDAESATVAEIPATVLLDFGEAPPAKRKK